MAVWVVIAFWIVVGLGVVLVAMRATRRRSAEAGESRAAARLSTLGFTAFFVGIGIAIPAGIMISNSDADERARGGVELSSGQAEGRQLFSQYCATCHTLAAANAVGRVGPNLDDLRPPEALTVNAIEEGRARGQGQMPADLLSGSDAQDVASFIAAVAGR